MGANFACVALCARSGFLLPCGLRGAASAAYPAPRRTLHERNGLLPHPHGFEGVFAVHINDEAGHLAFAYVEEVRSHRPHLADLERTRLAAPAELAEYEHPLFVSSR